jgi:hypothetical protein
MEGEEMKCAVCGGIGPDKFTREAQSWDWFTQYLDETVHFCQAHKNSPEQAELWRISQIPKGKETVKK